MPINCNLQFHSNLCKVQRTGKLCNHYMSEKLLPTLKYAAQHSIYATKSAVIDLSVAQSLLLCLFCGFLNGDIGFCLTLVELSSSLAQLDSSYFRVWLRDDFNFPKEEVCKVFAKLAEVVEDRMFQLPNNVTVALSGLIQKYGLLENLNLREDKRARRFVADINCHNFRSYTTSNDEASSTSETSQDSENSNSSQACDKEEVMRELRKAVLDNDSKAITILIESGGSLDYEMDNGDTLLHLAVAAGNLEIVNTLLKLGAFPSWRNKSYMTPIQLAFKLNNIEIVKALSLSGADVNQLNSEGGTLLHDAAAKGNIEMFKVILKLKAAINLRNNKGESPLLIATKANQPEAVETLLQAGADVNIVSNSGEAPLHVAVSGGYFKIFKNLLDSGALVNLKTKSGESPLHLAKDRHFIKLLVSAGADINESPVMSNSGNTPLHNAAAQGALEIAKTLIGLNANVNVVNRMNVTPLFEAVKAGHTEMVSLLVGSGADVNSINIRFNKSLLHFAVENEQVDCVRILLAACADVNVNYFCRSPLHSAIQNGNYQIVKLLIDNGANINAVNGFGEDPYLLASLNGHHRIAQLLVDRGVKTTSLKDYTFGGAPAQAGPSQATFSFGVQPNQSLGMNQSTLQQPANKSLFSAAAPPAQNFNFGTGQKNGSSLQQQPQSSSLFGQAAMQSTIFGSSSGPQQNVPTNNSLFGMQSSAGVSQACSSSQHTSLLGQPMIQVVGSPTANVGMEQGVISKEAIVNNLRGMPGGKNVLGWPNPCSPDTPISSTSKQPAQQKYIQRYEAGNFPIPYRPPLRTSKKPFEELPEFLKNKKSKLQ